MIYRLIPVKTGHEVILRGNISLEYFFSILIYC